MDLNGKIFGLILEHPSGLEITLGSTGYCVIKFPSGKEILVHHDIYKMRPVEAKNI